MEQSISYKECSVSTIAVNTKTQYMMEADSNNIKCTEAHILMSKNVRNKHILM